ncbi:unnamed protein product [Alopecurus aequalis]
MSPQEEEMLMFHSFVFPDTFPADTATPAGSGGEQKKAGRQQRRRKPRQSASAGDGDDSAAKKWRLSHEQAQFLEMSFRKERKLKTPRKVQLAAELGLDTKQLAVWFQNRRARYKSELIEEEFSMLRAAHDAVVVHNCHLETELLRLKEKLAEAEEQKSKVMAAVAAGGGGSSPCSSSFSTVSHKASMVEQFGMEDAEVDLSYMGEYFYSNNIIDLASSGYLGGLYDQFS